jgi:hypothetical protein
MQAMEAVIRTDWLPKGVRAASQKALDEQKAAIFQRLSSAMLRQQHMQGMQQVLWLHQPYRLHRDQHVRQSLRTAARLQAAGHLSAA